MIRRRLCRRHVALSPLVDLDEALPLEQRQAQRLQVLSARVGATGLGF